LQLRHNVAQVVTVSPTNVLRTVPNPNETSGNYEIDSRASLASPDFERGSVVSFSGSAGLYFEVENPRHPTGGTGRYWDFAVREWVQFELPSALRWELLDSSPFNPLTSRQ
jgi:hypothetical protein